MLPAWSVIPSPVIDTIGVASWARSLPRVRKTNNGTWEYQLTETTVLEDTEKSDARIEDASKVVRLSAKFTRMLSFLLVLTD